MNERYRQRVFDLAAALNASVGAEVLANQDASLNLATIDEALSDKAWLLAQVAAIEAETSPQRQRDAVGALVNYSNPGCVRAGGGWVWCVQRMGCAGAVGGCGACSGRGAQVRWVAAQARTSRMGMVALTMQWRRRWRLA